ncbi:MAG: transcriptional repressor [Bryobacteraceae bacterium]|nr:transcriptional repressor [Bryobacteraceae bacterium]
MNGQTLRQLCLERGLAVTHQRQVIWDVLVSLEGHPSPEEVYERVRKEIPSISLATIYKNLHTFVAHGLVTEVSLHHGLTRLEVNTHPHHHMVCTRCRAIFDLKDNELGDVQLKQAAPAGFQVHRYVVEVHGLCNQCAVDKNSNH